MAKEVIIGRWSELNECLVQRVVAKLSKLSLMSLVLIYMFLSVLFIVACCCLGDVDRVYELFL